MMHAYDRSLPEWFYRIRSHQIALPRFQRFVAWEYGAVSAFLTTVLRGLPAGAVLILQVGDKEKFTSRLMVGAPESREKVTEQLLDGQQRLTALWRSLHDLYQDRSYLIGFELVEEDTGDDSAKLPYVFGQARWCRDGKHYPLWVDNPRECWNRRHLPITLLLPEVSISGMLEWIKTAVGNDGDQHDKLLQKILALRDRVNAFNLPYLALPAETARDVAIDVFIKMNTSSVRLTTYDIVVALVEEETEKGLHKYLDEMNTAIPRASEYHDLSELMLGVVALRQDRIPGQASYLKLDYDRLLTEWEMVVNGVRGMVAFLEEEGIFDAQRLPSYTPLPILAALWEHLPTQPDKLGNARILLRKFLWRAFLTSRYEQSSTSNALQDYRGLKRVLCEGAAEEVVPILNEESCPLPPKELILQAGWPKGRTILGRGLLALQIKCGAIDFADNKPANVANITSKEHPRQYHHLFPVKKLGDAGIPDEKIYLALNCALLTWRTNLTISAKDPGTYLTERGEKSSLGKDESKRRLETHLIPYARLAVDYTDVKDDERPGRVRNDYEAFLSARADIMVRAVHHACQGGILKLGELLNDADCT
ncbi:MAG: GmrSD restriction endonuclease domain-containing protein [Desulfomonilaceae bacterium]